MIPGCLRGVSEGPGISRSVLQGPRKLQRVSEDFHGISVVLQGHFRGLQGGFRGSQWRFRDSRGVSGGYFEISEAFQGISGNLKSA